MANRVVFWTSVFELASSCLRRSNSPICDRVLVKAEAFSVGDTHS